MGRLLAPYGVRGWIKARPYSAVPGALLDYPSWWLTKDEKSDDWRVFRVVTARLHSGTIVAELEGLNTREAAMVWRGAWVGVPRTLLPQPEAGEFYQNELLGFEVRNRQGHSLGRVAGFLETGTHPVLRLAAEDGSQRLIPWVPQYVDSIDLAGKAILVDWQSDF